MLLDCWKNIREAFEHLDTEIFSIVNKTIKSKKKKKKGVPADKALSLAKKPL